MIYEYNDDEREKLRKRLEEDNKRELEDMLYFARNEGYFDGIEKGKEEGYTSGLEEGVYHTAKKLKDLDVAIEVIMKATGLSKDVIEELL